MNAITVTTAAGNEVAEVELEAAPRCAITVKVSDLITADGRILPSFWELWNAECTSNKKWMRHYGLAPAKVGGVWTVRKAA